MLVDRRMRELVRRISRVTPLPAAFKHRVKMIARAALAADEPEPTKTPVGAYRGRTDLLPLSPSQVATVDAFSQLTWDLWRSGAPEGRGTLDVSWLGTLALKSPLDLWIYQEILVETRPDLIIETGTHAGGSALFLASICDLIGNGRVVSIDLIDRPDRPSHPRVTYLHASSTSAETVATMTREAADAARVMVILDSDHSRDHVLAELLAYADLVTPGCYLVVEDTVVNGHPFFPEFGPGPWEAVDAFLARPADYVIDRDRERFLMTLNPRGYLRRVPRRFDADERARLQARATVRAEASPLDIPAPDLTPWHDARIAAGRAALAAGDLEAVEAVAQDVLSREPNCYPAYELLALARLSGVDYRTMLRELHERLAPRIYVEIGVYRGGSLRLALPQTRVLGIDPHPILDVPAGPNVRLFECTSGAFFAGGDAERQLDRGFDFAFVDGSHAMAVALLDFMALERFARPGSVMAFHDTLPVDARVATPVPMTGFYTGDVWKVVAALREYRPDLEIEALPCQPSGLTLVRNLDRDSRVLWRAYDEIVARFEPLPYSYFAEQPDARLLIRRGRAPAE